MKKINAYTIMEVTVAMLLSAIVIGICYSAYDIVGKYYTAFQKKNERADVLLALKQVMGKDIAKAGTVMKIDKGLVCVGDSLSISYLFEEGHILRKLDGFRPDTIEAAWKNLYVGFEGTMVSAPDTLDLIRFELEIDGQTAVPLLFTKHYSSQNLFH